MATMRRRFRQQQNTIVHTTIHHVVAVLWLLFVSLIKKHALDVLPDNRTRIPFFVFADAAVVDDVEFHADKVNHGSIDSIGLKIRAISIAQAKNQGQGGLQCQPHTVKPAYAGIEVMGHQPGIYIASSNLPLQTSNKTKFHLHQECAWDDARVLGGNIIVPWSKFDTGPKTDQQFRSGQRRYNLTWVEDQISLWSSRNKKVNLLVWAAAQQTGQQFNGKSATPQWLFDMGVPTVTCDDQNPSKGDPPKIAVHNAPLVRRKFQEALTFFYSQYKDDPRVNYFRFGAGVGSENYPMNSAVNPNGPCRKAWEEQGGDVDDWIDHVVTMVDFFGTLQNEGDYIATTPDAIDDRPESARDNKPIVVSLNDYERADANQLAGGRAGGTNEAIKAVFKAAQRRRLGIGCQGPTERHRRETEAGNGNACFWCSVYDSAKNDPRIPVLEIQTPTNFGPLGCTNCGDGTGPGYTPTGRIQALAPFLLEHGVTSFELYVNEFYGANYVGSYKQKTFGYLYNTWLDIMASGAVQNAQCKEDLVLSTTSSSSSTTSCSATLSPSQMDAVIDSESRNADP